MLCLCPVGKGGALGKGYITHLRLYLRDRRGLCILCSTTLLSGFKEVLSWYEPGLEAAPVGSPVDAWSVASVLPGLVSSSPVPSSPSVPPVLSGCSRFFTNLSTAVDEGVTNLAATVATSVVMEASSHIGAEPKQLEAEKEAVRLSDAAKCEVYVCFESPLGEHLKPEVKEKIWRGLFRFSRYCH